MEHYLNEIIQYSQIIYHFMAIFSILCAGIWFLISNKYRQRIQFDIENNFINTNNNEKICEIQLILENKGFLEYKIYDLAVSVKGMTTSIDKTTREGKFKGTSLTIPIFETQRIVESPNYYFVRPGVRQTITHNIKIPKEIHAISVLGGFTYKYKKRWEKELPEYESKRGALIHENFYKKHNHPHKAARIFLVPSSRVGSDIEN